MEISQKMSIFVFVPWFSGFSFSRPKKLGSSLLDEFVSIFHVHFFGFSMGGQHLSEISKENELLLSLMVVAMWKRDERSTSHDLNTRFQDMIFTEPAHCDAGFAQVSKLWRRQP